MFKKTFNTAPATTLDGASAGPARGLGALMTAYSDRRLRNDIVAIMSAFDHLSDRRLHMIGMRREDLFDTVGDMIRQAEEQRTIGREVIAMLNAPARNARDQAPTPRREAKARASAAA